jgi:hypothetical protein
MTTTKRNLGIIGILFIAALLLVPAKQAVAKSMKYKISGHVTKVEWIAVPDVEKHVIALYERRGVAIYENGESAAYHTRGTTNTIKGQGSFHGYSNYLFEDGSTIMTEYTGTMWYPSGKKLRSLKGEGKYIKGTGRFKGIEGKVSFTGKIIAPYTKDKTKGENVVDVTGNYTLPKK